MPRFPLTILRSFGSLAGNYVQRGAKVKPKVAILLLENYRGQLLYNKVVVDKDLKRLEQFAQVTTRLMPDAEPDTVRKAIAGADACLTGWGTPQLTAEIIGCSDCGRCCRACFGPYAFDNEADLLVQRYNP